MQTVGEVISAVLVTGPMSTPVRLLTELIEQPKDESANVEKDRAGFNFQNIQTAQTIQHTLIKTHTTQSKNEQKN